MANTIPHSAVARAKRNRATVEQLLVEVGTEGLPVLEIIDRLPMKHPVNTVLQWLRELAAEGRVERSNNGGPGCRWGPPGTYAAWKERRRKTDAQRLRRHAREAYAKALPDLASVASMPDKPVQVIVPAGTRPPPPTSGVRSIFEVAA